LINYADFKRVFHESDEEMESRGTGGEFGGNFEPIPPKPIPELASKQVDIKHSKQSHVRFITIQF
jgi:hypothetical protein